MKIAVIGTGYWGPNIVRNLVALRHKVFVFDRIPERSARMVEQFPQCSKLNSLDSILNERTIESVAIAVPLRDHYDLVIKSLRAGKHVFVEKPMCQTIKEAEQIGREINDTILMTGHITNFSPGIQMMRSRIKKGDIGALQGIALYRTQCSPVYAETDIITDVGAHDVAVLLLLTGKLPTSAIAVGYSRLDKGQSDAAHIIYRWKNSFITNIDLQWTSVFHTRRIIAEGNTGSLVFSTINGKEKLDLYEQTNVFNALRKGVTTHEIKKIPIEKKEIVLKSTEPLYEELKEFLRCIEEGRQPATGFDFSKKVVKVLEAARTSMQKNGERVCI
jgi:UDP-2-acetamido-3-amino-2,3-dideoxy-glucuronate N-acetyltransferase